MKKIQSLLMVLILSSFINQTCFAMERTEDLSSTQLVIFPTLLVSFLPLAYHSPTSMQGWASYLLEILPQSVLELLPQDLTQASELLIIDLNNNG